MAVQNWEGKQSFAKLFYTKNNDFFFLTDRKEIGRFSLTPDVLTDFTMLPTLIKNIRGIK